MDYTIDNKGENERKVEIMYYTSAEANKLLRKLKDELDYEKTMRGQNRIYIKALEEKDEDVRPDFDLEASNQKIQELQDQIRKLRHAINLFNVKTVVPETDLTIDQVLIRLPQLTDEIYQYEIMGKRPKKLRVGHTTTVIDYEIANYDPQEAKRLSDQYSDELRRLQNALDLVNTTVKGVEVDF